MRLLSSLVLAVGLVGCSVERTPPTDDTGVHPEGWTVKESPAFHATWLKNNGFSVYSRCGKCHGNDFQGGGSGIGCSGAAGCHQKPPSDCNTCHGEFGSARPRTGAHYKHQTFCAECHKVPTVADVETHAANKDRNQIVHLSGIALLNAKGPTVYDPDAKQCANVYCHYGTQTPKWDTTDAIKCDGCHKAPPDSHKRWARLATTPESCAKCHPGSDDPRHRNGTIDITVDNCTTCHGGDGHANPPTALDGSTDPASKGVGAHTRHLDATLADRIGHPVACVTCHVVPATVTEKGHYDQPTTLVRFTGGGKYDPAAQTCTVWCHWDKSPGPKWTDNSGAARKCGACHEFPPAVTRAGTPHPTVAGDVEICKACHVFDPSTHINGVVEFRK